MTREEAYYELIKLLCGEWDSYDEWLDIHLEIENPLSDIVLELIDCRDDIKETEYRLNLYCQEKPFDEESVYQRLRLEICEQYEKGEMNMEDVASALCRIARNIPFCDFYLECNCISDYYDFIDEGIADSDEFDFALKKWLKDGELFQIKLMWKALFEPKNEKKNTGFRKRLKKFFMRLRKKDKNV
ncbi:MAG: hypothetical protein IJA86_03665 [Clostridia bacterium]|nr:hypothetical protein [Clostridia bacterium]